jgi:hypothetical protein
MNGVESLEEKGKQGEKLHWKIPLKFSQNKTVKIPLGLKKHL